MAAQRSNNNPPQMHSNTTTIFQCLFIIFLVTIGPPRFQPVLTRDLLVDIMNNMFL